MKKIVVLLLALTMLTGIFACGNGGDPAPPAQADPAPPVETPDEPPPAAEATDEPIPVETPDEPDRDPNNDDLMAPHLGHDFGLGPTGHDIDALVERMGSDFVSDLRFGVIISELATPWQIAWVDEFNNLAAKYGFDLSIFTSGPGNAPQMGEDLRALHGQQVDVILAYLDQVEALVTTVNEIEAAGTPVINAVPVPAEMNITAYLYMDQVAMGTRMADQMAADFAAIGENAYVLVVSLGWDLPVLLDRERGFFERAEYHDNIVIVDQVWEVTEDGILNVILESLIVNEEVNATFTPWSFPFHATASAGRQLNRDIASYSTDLDDVAMQMLADGEMRGASHPLFARAHANLTVFLALRIVNGDTLPRLNLEPERYSATLATPENSALLLELIGR